MARSRQSPRSGQTGASAPLSSYITPYSTAEDRHALLAKQIDADLAGTGLEPWEERFCKWCAVQPLNNVPMKRQTDVASHLAGTTISASQIKLLKSRPQWRRLWAEQRDADLALRHARTEYSGLVEESPKHYRAMLQKAVTDKDVRAATPLLIPLLDRALPKQTDDAALAPRELHIHLTESQARGLVAPAHVVEAEEVEAEVEVISVETLPPGAP